MTARTSHTPPIGTRIDTEDDLLAIPDGAILRADTGCVIVAGSDSFWQAERSGWTARGLLARYGAMRIIARGEDYLPPEGEEVDQP